MNLNLFHLFEKIFVSFSLSIKFSEDKILALSLSIISELVMGKNGAIKVDFWKIFVCRNISSQKRFYFFTIEFNSDFYSPDEETRLLTQELFPKKNHL